MAKSEDKEKSSNVQSVERAFHLLEIISRAPSPVNVQELSDLTGISRTTVHGLVNTLYSMKYIERASIRGRYQLSPKLYSMICSYPHRLPVVRTANRYLIRLSEKFNTTVHLGILSPEKEVLLIKAYYTENLSNISTSNYFPLHASAIGKMLLANLPQERREDLLESLELVQYTRNTITDRNKLRQELEAIRQRGYSRDDAEYLDNTHCLAFPIWNADGTIAASFSLSDMTNVDSEKNSLIIPEGLQCSKQCSREMGWSLGTMR